MVVSLYTQAQELDAGVQNCVGVWILYMSSCRHPCLSFNDTLHFCCRQSWSQGCTPCTTCERFNDDNKLVWSCQYVCLSFPTFVLQAKLDAGVYTLHDVRVLCRKEDKHWCPYYLARHMLAFANVIVYNYQYMLDPKVTHTASPYPFLINYRAACSPSPMSSCATTSTCSTPRRGVFRSSSCGHSVARHMLAVIVLQNQYMLDPRFFLLCVHRDVV